MRYLDEEEFWDEVYAVRDRLSAELDLSSLSDAEAVDLAASAVKGIMAETENLGVEDSLSELLSIWFSIRAAPAQRYQRALTARVGDLAYRYGFRRKDIPTPTHSAFRPADFLGMFAASRFSNRICAFQDVCRVYRDYDLLDLLAYALYLSEKAA